MKNTKQVDYRLLLLFAGLVIFGVAGCGRKDDGEGPSEQEEQEASAILQIGEQQPFPMTSSVAVAAAAQANKISLNFTDTRAGVMLQISLISTQEKIAAGQTYSLIPGNMAGDGMGTAKLNPVGSSSGIQTNFTTVKDVDGDNQFDGSGTVKITLLTEDRIAGTFSIIMYSDAGEKAIIKEGAFNMAMDFTF